MRNHRWTEARRAARARDGYRCLGCGAGEKELNAARLGALGPRFRWQAHEVDHVARAFGAHGAVSCSHHQANLRTLCRPCHLAKTRADRARDGR